MSHSFRTAQAWRGDRVFGSLEDEIVRILQANLSPTHVPADHIIKGPAAAPAPADMPLVAVSADGFRLSPDEAASPPRASRSPVTDTFAEDGTAPLTLSRPPLQPLRSVEVEEPSAGGRVVLHERDDYIVDYVNGRVRLRQAPVGTVHVDYFTSTPFRVTSATRLRVEYHLDVFGDAAPDGQGGDTIAAVAVGSLAANAASIDGLRTEGRDVVDSGLPGVPRQVFFVFETPLLVAGAQDGPTHWRIDYGVDAWMILLPVGEPVGVVRHVATGVAWDEHLAAMLISGVPPILARPTSIVQGVDAASAAILVGRAIRTLGQLADAEQIGPPEIDTAIGRARTIRAATGEVVSRLVAERPRIADVAAFLSLRLTDVDVGDLTEVGVQASVASEIVAATRTISEATTVGTLALSDLVLSPS
jgi:hypothetical protein